jgi:hypothetical protein
MTTATSTRRLTVILPLPQVEALRRLQRPGEGMNELLKRLLTELTTAPAP